MNTTTIQPFIPPAAVINGIQVAAQQLFADASHAQDMLRVLTHLCSERAITVLLMEDDEGWWIIAERRTVNEYGTPDHPRLDQREYHATFILAYAALLGKVFKLLSEQ